LHKYDDYTDEKIIELLREAEHTGSKVTDDMTDYLMEKYKPLVRKKTNALFLIGGETDDLIQEGMIGLFKAVRDYSSQRESSFYHFAELCINRQLYSALTASNRKKHMPLNTYVSLSAEEHADGMDLEELLSSANEKNPEEMVIQQEFWKDFQKKLSKNLSKMERQVLQLYLEGIPYTQIARQMDKTPKSIDNAIQRIRQKIGAMKAGE
jgi:RNA polymerase sporulation-specific sigma factor